MRITKQARRDAKVLFRACLVNGLLDEAKVRDVAQKVVAAKPRGYFGILSHFQRLVKLELDRRSARIESAVPLGAHLQASVEASLGRLYGPGLSFDFRQNAALIGGMRVKVGSDVYDGSIQARLNALVESF
ncbi:MAG TPA: F0F1 ATP synthase subunit delta [Verrucomicrobiae bacterium]